MNKQKIARELVKIAKELEANDVAIADTIVSKMKGVDKELNGVQSALNRIENKEMKKMLMKSLQKLDDAYAEFKNDVDKSTIMYG